MNASDITAGSDDLLKLAEFTNRDHAGRHFTEVYQDDFVESMEGLGLIAIERPIHEATGLPYDQQYWRADVTEEGRQLVEDRYDPRDYPTGTLADYTDRMPVDAPTGGELVGSDGTPDLPRDYEILDARRTTDGFRALVRGPSGSTDLVVDDVTGSRIYRDCDDLEVG